MVEPATAPAPRACPPPSARMEWMDLLRGLAIVLVILFHAIGIPWWYHGIDVPEWMYVVASSFGPFRMPMLVMLSGMLLGRALAKPPARYLSGKARTLLWPFAVWAVLEIFTVSWLTNDVSSSIVSPMDWLEGGTHLWFLLFLAAYYLIALVARPVPAWFMAIALWQISVLVPEHPSRFLY